MKIVVVRHYKTKSNTQDLIMGWSDSPPEDGSYDDLLFVSEKLLHSKFNFNSAWSSNLERAQQTACYFAKQLGLSGFANTSELNEINYGALTNKDKKWVDENFPLHKKDASFVYPEGESFNQMQNRCVSFVNKLINKNSGDHALLIAHAGVIRGLICYFLKLPYSEHLRCRIGHRYIGVFDFNETGVVAYSELGEHSGCISDKIIQSPMKMTLG